ncbi:tRNA uridine-5-carboxymethylaminomethyl(34) synthesis GTPase MnmE [Pseudorhodoplanes sinuspersici]|uniref:tRNA modification GTPase MnmE n=1 Tax=Pseudorhodoplanes sinuspersici TaxID=1235591 RepID=A0A1W6ZNV5_9HYPH|nr:tRNA uridine-5-carboxymethylaminomethyl(34) synthesis GTPase MnmE [Pseudorhodoplanes sinuspersici]ARP99049.1 tRNA uridine-5-carboxymethylaminomethyl(34) synthesis GTPase MnmE [Pseudorhodoplanes sinuspersici]RKE69305.1 tRNA modification GTPase trmE [Pseudorhodoplanes sinuspersici]
MTVPARETIYALSSGSLPAAIGVVRISGPQAKAALLAMIGRVPAPRQAAFATVRDPQSGGAIDQALVLFFEGPNSETGEDVAEFQLHGGRAVVAATFNALSKLEGMRMAEAGEFTRRAFENGKLDLTAIEGLADLIYADTESQRKQAIRQLQGLLGNRAEAWRRRLIEALALVEAGIDFSDEADVAADVTSRSLEAVRALQQEIAAVLAEGRRGERMREGLVVAIAGPPNAGKSTLLNKIARRDVAIVSPYAGTTRDVIEVHLDLEGFPVTLLDTAGIREATDPVEQEGVARARARAAEADLVLWLMENEGANPVSRPDSPETWTVRTKIDLGSDQSAGYRAEEYAGGSSRPEQRHFYELSAVSGEGVDRLLTDLTAYARNTLESREPALITRERQRNLLEMTEKALKRGILRGEEGQEDLFAEELRLASQSLGRITGRVDVEDILDVIFRDFCIGK